MINVKNSELSQLFSLILSISTIYGLNNETTKCACSTISLHIIKYTKYVFSISGYGLLLYLIYCNIENGYDTLMGVELVIKIVVSNLTGIIMAVCSFIYQQRFIDVISLMKVREEKLEEYMKNSTSSKSIKLFVYSQFILLIILQVHNFLVTYFKFCKREDRFVACIGGWLAFNLYPSISYVHSIMFSTTILIIKRHIFLINQILLNTYLQNKRRINAEIKLLANSNFKSHKLLLLKKIHSNLTSDSKQIMHIFAIPTLIKFLDGFLFVFCCIHFFITDRKMASAQLKPYAVQASMLSLNAAIVPITELLSVILICQKTSTESLQTTVVLHKLYATYRRQKNLIKVVSSTL